MPATEMVDWKELGCFVHLIGMVNSRKPRNLWERRVEGLHVSGRVRAEWEDCL
jgi:hypothetical protein